MKRRQPKSISFNLMDEYEKKLLDHAEKGENGNFSRYIKRLIANDMEGWQARPAAPVNSQAKKVIKEKPKISRDSMGGFL
ncbi:hypothetical protein MKY41_11275 [Sporosarcina sp. FSL W7-1349]|uniref:hypothetical protein n=1 Tax=Sporosarcina sp. FSL W7-1349 TaxID=2921561 RepID=UPI0030F9FDAB